MAVKLLIKFTQIMNHILKTSMFGDSVFRMNHGKKEEILTSILVRLVSMTANL